MSHLGEKDFTNRLDYIQAQKDLIHKGLYGGLPCEDVIMKGGEGSKGGKVIGHTKSGKPIYENAKHASHREFTSSEHKEAIDFHNKKMKTDKGNETTHYNQIDHHEAQVTAKKNKESKDSKEETFEHHRMMAGYHASKEQEIADRQEDFRSSSDKQLHESADELEGERKKHQDKEHEHKKKAEKLHDPKKHGDWNSTIPKEKDALEYGAKHDVKKAEGDNFDGTFDKAMTAEAGEGVTQKESVEHNPKDMQNAKPSDLKKAYEILGLVDLIEKAEGSRGGKVIGHTKSGKPIYASPKDQADFHSFTKEDHKEASDLHAKEGEKIPMADRYKADRRTKTKKYDDHSRAASRHADFAKEGEKQVESESSHSRKNFPNFGKF